MAAEGRGSNTSLDEQLFEEPYRFDFFQAVRLLGRMNAARVPVGRHGSGPDREVVRFRSHPSLQFPPSQIVRLQNTADGNEPGDAPPEMVVSFMGMIGPVGVLPNHITELVAERVRYKDTAMWSFLDLFGHRMVSLFYRAWERYRFTVAFERGDRDHFSDYLFSLIGLGTRGVRDDLKFPHKGLLLYSGLIAQRPHSASALEAVLSDYFGINARVNPFTGQWLKLDPESLCLLGSANSELGIGTIAGDRVWDVQSKFRMTFGPLTLSQFRRFIPSNPDSQVSAQLIKLMTGDELDFDLQLILRADEVPHCSLSASAETRPMLGWTTWLKTRPFTADDSQVVFSFSN
jgi:type VI secretion system protein ImpH